VSILIKKSGKILGLDGKELELEEFVNSYQAQGFSYIESEKFITQAYVFIVTTLSNGTSYPFHYYGLSADDVDVLQSHLETSIEVFLQNECTILAVAADGGSSCRKLLKRFLPGGSSIYAGTIHPISDMDHLMKTIRNRLYSGNVKINNRTLEWNIIVREFNREGSPLPKVMKSGSVEPRYDKMDSSYMRSIFCYSFAKYLMVRSKEEIGDSKTDYINLATFCMKCATYIHAWEAPNDDKNTLSHPVRFTLISDATNFLVGNDSKYVVSGLTKQSITGLKLNEGSWTKLMSILELTDLSKDTTMNWRSCSSMLCENFFSIMRSKVGTPTMVDFITYFDNTALIMDYQFHEKSVGFSFGDRKRESVYHAEKATEDNSPYKDRKMMKKPKTPYASSPNKKK